MGDARPFFYHYEEIITDIFLLIINQDFIMIKKID